MRRDAAECDPLADDAEAGTAHAPVALRGRMRRERRDRAIEHPGAEEIDLPAAALFGRRADELDADLEP